MRKFLWMSYLTGTSVDAQFLGHLAWHIGKCGGHGVDDFAVNPNSNMGHAKIKLLLGREFDDPDLTYPSTVLHDKKTDQRIEARIPIHVPSKIFERNFKDFEQPTETAEPATDVVRFDCARWRDHSIRKASEGKVHWSRVVPAALYWDGVEFQNRDSFFTICVRDLRANVSYPMIILRRALSHN